MRNKQFLTDSAFLTNERASVIAFLSASTFTVTFKNDCTNQAIANAQDELVLNSLKVLDGKYLDLDHIYHILIPTFLC